MLTELVKETSEEACFAGEPGVDSSPGLLAYWHLLSLDAPTVAAVWTWFVARSMHLSLSPFIPLTVFLGVWVLYAVDRLLDTRELPAWPPSQLSRGHSQRLESTKLNSDLQRRHFFHRAHRRHFKHGLVVASALLLPLIARIPASTMHLYVLLGFLLLVWFGLIHRLIPSGSKPLPKELAVGLFFSAAVFIPSLLHWQTDRRLVTPAIFFALLCSLNCVFIFAWEHEHTAKAFSAHPSTLQAIAVIRTSAGLLVFVPLFLAWAHYGEETPLFFATSLAAAGLLTLHQFRSRIDAVSLRAAADLALLTPLVIAPWIR